MRGRIEQEIARGVTVSVTYNPQQPEDVKIDKVEFQDKSVEIEVDEQELGSSAEDEWNDMDDFVLPDEP